MSLENGSFPAKDRTTFSLSITTEDKKILQQAALDQGTTAAALVHQWIQTYLKKNEAQ